MALHIDGNGDLLFAAYYNHQGQLYASASPGSNCTEVAATGTAGSGAAQLRNPNGIVVDSPGDDRRPF